MILPRCSEHLAKRVISEPEVDNEEVKATARNKYTAQFKEQVLARADRDGISTVAKDLELAESMLYSWRAKRRQTRQLFEDQKLQQAELARLKRENAQLGEEMASLKKAAAYPQAQGRLC